MAYLVDTNILVYRFDARFPEKQAAARDLLRKGLAEDAVRIPHQALLEFVAVVTRVRAGLSSKPLLAPDEARHETEELMVQFPVLFPNAALARTALQGAAAYQLSWFDAHLWAYAEHYGLEEIASPRTSNMAGCMAASGCGIHFGERESACTREKRARLLAPLRFCGTSLRGTGQSPVTTHSLVPNTVHERPQLS